MAPWAGSPPGMAARDGTAFHLEMMGSMPKQADKCDAICMIADDQGDNDVTFVCQKPRNHEGLHEEKSAQDSGIVTVTWEFDFAE